MHTYNTQSTKSYRKYKHEFTIYFSLKNLSFVGVAPLPQVITIEWIEMFSKREPDKMGSQSEKQWDAAGLSSKCLIMSIEISKSIFFLFYVASQRHNHRNSYKHLESSLEEISNKQMVPDCNMLLLSSKF